MTYSILQDQLIYTGEYCVKYGGIYDQYDLVICYSPGDINKEPLMKFEAKYVVLGSQAYQ